MASMTKLRQARLALKAKASIKPVTEKQAAEEADRFRIALEIIAGRRQCLDNLMSNAEVAAAALDNT